MSNQYLRELSELAYNVASLTKAASQVSGEQVLPTRPYTNGSGVYDPDDGRAYTSRLSQKRVGYAAAQVDQGNTKMIDLHPYKNVINTNYQSLNKYASYDDEAEFGYEDEMFDDEEAFLEAYAEELEESGYFDDVSELPHPDMLEIIKENALEKAASTTDAQIEDMINYGMLEDIGVGEYVDELMDSDEELDYYFDDEDEYEGY